MMFPHGLIVDPRTEPSGFYEVITPQTWLLSVSKGPDLYAPRCFRRRRSSALAKPRRVGITRTALDVRPERDATSTSGMSTKMASSAAVQGLTNVVGVLQREEFSAKSAVPPFCAR
jgi:hypothetical protein